MKTRKRLIQITLAFLPLFCFGQELELSDITIRYDNDKKVTKNVIEGGIPTTNTKELLFNDKMLNFLISDRIGSFFTGSDDLNVNKYYGNLDAGENSLSIGANYENRESELDKLNWIISLGAKFNFENSFALIAEDYTYVNNNVGVKFKASKIFKGSIFFSPENKIQVKKLETDILYPKYKKTVEDFNKNKLKDFLKLKRSEIEVKNPNIRESEIKEKLKEEIKKKEDEFYIDLAKEEVEYLENYDLYDYVTTHWLSIDAFIPVGTSEFKVAETIDSEINDKKFYQFQASVSYNRMYDWAKHYRLFLKSQVKLKNNNSVLINDIDATNFITQTVNTNNFITQTTTEAFVLNYQEFLTPSFSLEAAFFMFNKSFGISPGIEFNFGDYNETNYKVGLPLSFKDREGKPKVNFEILWKRQHTLDSSVDIIGISTSLLFGKLIN